LSVFNVNVCFCLHKEQQMNIYSHVRDFRYNVYQTSTLLQSEWRFLTLRWKWFKGILFILMRHFLQTRLS